MLNSTAGSVIERLTFIAAVGLIVFILVSQLRRPSRWLGGPFLFYMNLSHSAVTDWGLKHTQIKKDSTILDVGCGGGRTVTKLAALAPEGKVYGVDFADGSVAASRKTNASLIEAARVEIKQASVSRLPFPENSIDLVTAIETQYYWPDIVGDMQEIRRVLKPGGTLLVIAETYRKGKLAFVEDIAMKLVRGRLISVNEERSFFGSAGYVNVNVLEEPSRGWLCVSGAKPSSAET